jgi:zinc protease
MSRLIRTALFAAVLSALQPAYAAIDLAAPIPVGPQVKVGKLPNGLTYYIHRNGKPEHRLELRLVVKAGSVLEEDDQQGLAHMLEHLAFNGSTHFKKQELVSYLESIGVKFGADLNAQTGFDETVYILPVPTDRKDNVEKAFTVLEDWAHGVMLADEAIDKERAIVLEELRSRKGAAERVRKALWPKMFNGARYAQRDPGGKEEVLRTFKPDAVRRFYRDWYRPDLMAVIVVGDVDPAEAERLVKAHFGGLANPTPERPRTYPDVPPVTKSEAIVVTDSEIPNNGVTLRYPVRYLPDAGTYGSYRDKMVESMAVIMLNQRLAELSQQANPPFLGAGSGMDTVTPRHKAFIATAVLGAGGATPAITALQQEQQRVRQFGYTAAELDRVRKMILSSMERSYNERSTTDSARYVAEYQRNFLAGESLPGIEAEYKLVQEMLPAITLDDVNAYARKTFPADAGKLVVYIGGTKGAPAPTDAQLLADVTAADRLQVAAREEKALAAKLMDRPAATGRIVEESRDAKLGLTRLTLSNGVKVILKPTTFRKDEVVLGALRYGGQTQFDAKDLPSARSATHLVGMMGLKDFTPTDLQKILAGRKAAANVGMDNYTDTISGRSGSSPEDLETMFQVLWLRFNGVRRDENLYKSFMGQATEAVRNRLAVPEQRFGDMLADTLYAGHPYEPRQPTPQEVAAIDLDRSIALYRQRFSSAKGLTFTLAGDFDVDKIKPLVTSYLGTLPTPDLPLAYRDVGLRFAQGVVKKEVKAGTEPKSFVSLNFTGPATWSPTEELRMRALTEVMNLRVIEVLREKLGLIYSGQVGGSVQRIPYPHYAIQTMLPTGPEKVGPLLAATFAEIDRLKAEGPTQAELDKVKAGWHQTLLRAQQDNSYWVWGIEGALLEGTDPARLLTIEDEIRAIGVADVKSAAQRYLNKDNYVQVVMNPEAPVKTASTDGAAGTAGKTQ